MICLPPRINWTYKLTSLGYSRKKIKQVVEDIIFWKNLNSGENKLSPLKILQNCVAPPWKSQVQKPRPMEIPHEFFFNTPGNSSSFLIESWDFHMPFFQYP